MPGRTRRPPDRVGGSGMSQAGRAVSSRGKLTETGVDDEPRAVDRDRRAGGGGADRRGQQDLRAQGEARESQRRRLDRPPRRRVRAGPGHTRTAGRAGAAAVPRRGPRPGAGHGHLLGRAHDRGDGHARAAGRVPPGRPERGLPCAGGVHRLGPDLGGVGVSRAEEFEQLRPLLFSIAYRILGSVAEAEDAVQETWLRYEDTAEEPRSPKAFLSTVVTRIAIDVLRSARVRRESYAGPWFPE